MERAEYFRNGTWISCNYENRTSWQVNRNRIRQAREEEWIARAKPDVAAETSSCERYLAPLTE